MKKIDAKQNIAHRFFEHQTPQTIHFFCKMSFQGELMLSESETRK